MLSGLTCSPAAMAGSAVLRMVVSSDSMKKATATIQGRSRLSDAPFSAFCMGCRRGLGATRSGRRDLARELERRVQVIGHPNHSAVVALEPRLLKDAPWPR